MTMETMLHQTEALARAREDIATHRAEIAELRRDIAELREAVEGMHTLMLTMQSTLSEARGGWRMLLLVGGAGAAAATGVAWVVDHLPRWVR